jgi:3-methylcrotonyl-CoA carboxylase alpha subunit
MLKSLLIANRGEIACRIIRTAHRLGIRVVAVYSDADAGALHVRQADEAIHIGPSPVRESYLVGEKIIAAALKTGAEAIHPGYGFLSENATFAQDVFDAGLVWIGPRPSSIRAMGLKDAAKELMAKAGVPVTPGYFGEDQSLKWLQGQAEAVGYPVLIKAVAGGGGKGMRRVDTAAEFPDMLLSCKREAAASFGDDRVLIEKCIECPRHIEVQVFGDSYGNIVHLFERDCSLQRRYQKVIEEAPAPGMDAATRKAVCEAAVKAARAVDYIGAGTIEFIADAREGLRADRIWFMEMNTRLQVEHPVTEEITGQDLVEWQIRVASGEPLPQKQEELTINGNAIEARLYAEDPAKQFLPSIGKLEYLKLPKELIRVESGVEQGAVVSPFYDPMIAKLVVHEPTRAQAIKTLAKAASATAIWPVKTNAAFLARVLSTEAFAAGDINTGFIPARIEELVPADEPAAEVLQAAAMALAKHSPGKRMPHGVNGSFLQDEAKESPWFANFGFRLNGAPCREIRMQTGPEVFQVEVRNPDGQLPAWVEPHRNQVLVGRNDGLVFAFEVPRPTGVQNVVASDGMLVSPMPGRVIGVAVRIGDKVTKGQKLLILEAMKMEHSLTAPFAGLVAELHAMEGAQISEGTLLVRIEMEAGSE